MLYAVQRGDVDEAVVPIENSLEGANVTLIFWLWKWI